VNSEESSQADGQPTRLRWLGHSTFLLSSPGGVQVLLGACSGERGDPVPEVPTIDRVAGSH